MPYGRYNSGPDIMSILMPIISIVVGLIVLSIIIKVVKSKNKKGITGSMNVDNSFMGMRGRTPEQKKIIKYFSSTGIMGAIFKISDSAFDGILGAKVNECRSWINARALNVHGMDADEVKETTPILVENYATDSRFFKIFRDLTFRASEYQMSYLLFGEKQMYAYSHTFDLTSANTTERTREYFYEDITDVDVTQKKIEFPNPRPLGYLVGGIACIIFGLILMMAVRGGAGVFFGLAGIVTGIVLAFFLGYTRSVVDNLVLRLTVPGDEFICAMKPENMVAIQGMKAKIREKKK